jgi:hypothetical protein
MHKGFILGKEKWAHVLLLYRNLIMTEVSVCCCQMACAYAILVSSGSQERETRKERKGWLAL